MTNPKTLDDDEAIRAFSIDVVVASFYLESREDNEIENTGQAILAAVPIVVRAWRGDPEAVASLKAMRGQAKADLLEVVTAVPGEH